MKLLVTGGTGLLGSELIRSLEPWHTLVGWARRPHQHPLEVFESVDLNVPEAIRKRFDRFKPQAVIHTAAISDIDYCQQHPEAARKTHEEATAVLAACCKGAGALLICVSTDYVFDGALGRPYKETDPPHPLGAYAQSKRKAELAALSGTDRVIVVRVSGLFGPGRRNFVSGTINRLKEREPVSVVTDQINSPSYTVDLARGFSKLIQKFERHPDQAKPGGSLHGLLHMANAGGGSRLEVVRQILRRTGAPESLIKIKTWADLNRPAPRPPDSRLDCGRYNKVLGTPLRSWQEALEAFLSAELDSNPPT